MSPYRDDPELGRVKRCSRCHEEWPVDEEFYHFTTRRLADGSTVKRPAARCIACFIETYTKVYRPNYGGSRKPAAA